MAERTNSKLGWFAELLLRLVIVTVVCLFVAFLLGSVWRSKLHFNAASLGALILIVTMAGYAWAIYFELPFFTSRTKRQRMLIATGLALVPLAVTCGSLVAALAQFMIDMRRARFVSPADSANEVWFYDGGCLDRDCFLFAKRKWHGPQFVARLDRDTEYRPDAVQWTQDGHVAVCSLIMLNGIWPPENPASTNQERRTATIIAYDFSRNLAITPLWFGNFHDQRLQESSWRDFEPVVQKLVALHGGLTSPRITDDLVRKNEHNLWFWQIPNTPPGM